MTLVRVTCVEDGRDHLVTPDAMAAGLKQRAGRYRALCGHVVTAGGMAQPPGPPCKSCGTQLRASNSRPRCGRHRRHRRPTAELSSAFPEALGSAVPQRSSARALKTAARSSSDAPLPHRETGETGRILPRQPMNRATCHG